MPPFLAGRALALVEPDAKGFVEPVAFAAEENCASSCACDSQVSNVTWPAVGLRAAAGIARRLAMFQ
jgi:hypothetical protein